MTNIGIIGCGWLGLHLAKHLQPQYKIFTTTTSETKKSELLSNGFKVTVINFSDSTNRSNDEIWENLDALDSLIITVPFQKRVGADLLEQRFKNVSQFINGYEKQLFLMSSIGIYPQIETDISENTVSDGLLVPNLVQVENLMKYNFPQINILRLGGLMGNDRIFSKYKVELNNQIVNHVHYEDICSIIEQMIQSNCTSKLYNVVAPLHPTKVEVFNFQKGIHGRYMVNENPKGRKILTDLLINDLNYKYKNPDPKTFF